MKQPSHHDSLDAVAAAPVRQTRLRALLFTGATLGTTLLIIAPELPKLPLSAGE